MFFFAKIWKEKFLFNKIGKILKQERLKNNLTLQALSNISNISVSTLSKMENDLCKRGYNELCLGVKPRNVRNMEIYFHLGFREYIKSIVEYEPVKGNEAKKEMVFINYFKKKIN